jgi:predicted ATP-dependent serine protease
MEPKRWRCSQCGTINEPGTRSCSNCGKWPSLFDLQDDVVEEEPRPEVVRTEVFEAETFEPEVFRPDVSEVDIDEVEEGDRPGRFPRWLVTAIWVTGLAVWILINAFSDRG